MLVLNKKEANEITYITNGGILALGKMLGKMAKTETAQEVATIVERLIEGIEKGCEGKLRVVGIVREAAGDKPVDIQKTLDVINELTETIPKTLPVEAPMQ